MSKSTRKAVTLLQEQYDEMVEFHRSNQVIPERMSLLKKDQRSKWLKKARDKFKVMEGDGLGLPGGYGLYQKLEDPVRQTPTWKLHVPPSSVKSILNHFHPHSADESVAIGAHVGVRSTYNKICENHTGITYLDVEEHTKQCPICRDNSKIPAAEKDIIPIISHHVNERWVIDTTYLRKYRRQNHGYGYLGVVVDHFSKRVWAFPMRTKTAAEWAFHLIKLILEHDAPRIIHSDNGGEFVNSIVEEIARLFHIRLVNGGPYEPQQQGIVERMNDTLKTRLSTKMHEQKTKKWMQFLPFVVADYNMTPHTVTKYPPFELFNGGRPIQVVHSTKDPINSEIQHFTAEQYEEITKAKRERFIALQKMAEERIVLNGERMSEKFTKNKPSKFEVGTFVAIKYSYFTPSKNGKQPKLVFGEKRWPKHGVIIEITSKRKFVIKLSTGEVTDKPINRRYLKLVKRANTNQDVDIAISESDSSRSESSSVSGSYSSASESTSSSSAEQDKSSESGSLKDKQLEKLKEASVARRQSSVIQKPTGMSWTRFYIELEKNPEQFGNSNVNNNNK